MVARGENMQKIIVFGLTEEETEIIRDCGLQFELIPCNVYQDVIAYYADLTIINPKVLDNEARSCFEEFYREIDPTNEKVILTSEDRAFDGISFVEIIPNLFEYPDSIQMILMKRLKDTKRDVDFSRRIMLAIKILHIISQTPGITTRKIIEMVEGTSDRSVKRYIRSLQAAGIMIEYQNKGWFCLMEPKHLL